MISVNRCKFEIQLDGSCLNFEIRFLTLSRGYTCCVPKFVIVHHSSSLSFVSIDHRLPSFDFIRHRSPPFTIRFHCTVPRWQPWKQTRHLVTFEWLHLNGFDHPCSVRLNCVHLPTQFTNFHLHCSRKLIVFRNFVRIRTFQCVSKVNNKPCSQDSLAIRVERFKSFEKFSSKFIYSIHLFGWL